MTATLDQVRRARPDLLRDAAAAVRRQGVLVGEVLAELIAVRVVWARWTGSAAGAATAEHEELIRQVQAVCRAVSGTAAALVRAAEELRLARVLVHKADALAAEAGGWVEPGGRLVLPPRLGQAGDVTAAAAAARAAERLRWDVEALVGRACERAGAADRELARALTEAVSQNACFPAPAPVEVLRPPGLGGRPAEWLPFANAAWWQALSPAEQQWAIAEHPDWVGPRDGVPAWARHAANLLLLAKAEKDARRVLEELLSRRGALADPLMGVGLQGQGVGLARREVLADLTEVRRTLSQADGISRQLLLLDTSGPLVKAVVAVGDVDRAEHVATFVGGFTTTVRADLVDYDRIFTRMREKGNARAGGEGLAVVTWMGYPAPQADEVLSASRSVLVGRVARQNAGALASFANGIDAARERPAHQTLWAHSYGSVLGGYALTRNQAFDDVVLFGSPGVAFSSLSQAGLKPGALNVLKADWDPIAYSGWLGTDPAEVPGVTMLSTDVSKTWGLNPGLPSTGHSQYLKPGSTSEANLMAVAIGRPDLRALADD